MGTPEFAVPILQALLETQNVVGVVTQPDRPAGRGQELRPSPVKVVAEVGGVPLYQPASLRSPEAAAPLQAWAPEAILVAAFGQILRPHVLALPPRGCINVHASLLPRWRGAAPIQHAILAGDDVTGITLMQMDEGLDTGPIWQREALPIHPEETAATLHDRLARLGAAMVRQHLGEILAGHESPVPQDDAAATYAPMIDKEDGRLDWAQPAQLIDRRIRAMTPWPGAFTTWRGRRLKVLAAHPQPDVTLPGVTAGGIAAADGRVLVATGDGAIALQEVQLAGKRATPVDDFVRGRPDFIGSYLGD
jgi:methionyl-tRNA formyltransferase